MTHSSIIIMKVEKNLKILSLSLVTVLIVVIAGTSAITPAVSVSETGIEDRGCLSYQIYPSQVDCAASIVPSGPLRV